MKTLIITLFILFAALPAFAAPDLDVLTTNDVALGVTLDGTITNIGTSALGNANTSYTYFQLAASGYNQFVLQYSITATTLTIEGSSDRLTVPNDSATWSDITTTLTGSASLTSTGSLTITTKLPWPRLRIKRVTTNATNALVLKLTRAYY
ncbi:MAG: hypothetical protein QG556_377 [Pseudomonadota bacterium]|nr:hypothetical protein [Pseudomonadota bacterium]